MAIVEYADTCEQEINKCRVAGVGARCYTKKDLEAIALGGQKPPPEETDPAVCFAKRMKRLQYEYEACMYYAINEKIYGGGPYSAQQAKEQNTPPPSTPPPSTTTPPGNNTPNEQGNFVPTDTPPHTIPNSNVKYSHYLAYIASVPNCRNAFKEAFIKVMRNCFCTRTDCGPEYTDDEDKPTTGSWDLTGGTGKELDTTSTGKTVSTDVDKTTETDKEGDRGRSAQIQTDSRYGWPIVTVFGTHRVVGNIVEIRKVSSKIVTVLISLTTKMPANSTIQQITMHNQVIYTFVPGIDSAGTVNAGKTQRLTDNIIYAPRGRIHEYFETDVGYRDQSLLLIKNIDLEVQSNNQFPAFRINISRNSEVKNQTLNSAALYSTGKLELVNGYYHMTTPGETKLITQDLDIAATHGFDTRPLIGENMYAADGTRHKITGNLVSGPTGAWLNSVLVELPGSNYFYASAQGSNLTICPVDAFAGLTAPVVNQSTPAFQLLCGHYSKADVNNKIVYYLYGMTITSAGITINRTTLWEQDSQLYTGPRPDSPVKTINIANSSLINYEFVTPIKSLNTTNLYLILRHKVTKKLAVVTYLSNSEYAITTIYDTLAPLSRGEASVADTDLFSYIIGNSVTTVDLYRQKAGTTSYAVPPRDPLTALEHYRPGVIVYKATDNKLYRLFTYVDNVSSHYDVFKEFFREDLLGDVSKSEVTLGYKIDTVHSIQAFLANYTLIYGSSVRTTGNVSLTNSPIVHQIPARLVGEDKIVDNRRQSMVKGQRMNFFLYVFLTQTVALTRYEGLENKSDGTFNSFETTAVLTQAQADEVVERLYALQELSQQRTVNFAPSVVWLEPGDVVDFNVDYPVVGVG